MDDAGHMISILPFCLAVVPTLIQLYQGCIRVYQVPPPP